MNRLDVGTIDLRSTLTALDVLHGDPSVMLRPGQFQRATHTPDGPGTIELRWGEKSSTVSVRTFGAGGDWLAERAPQLVGLFDDMTGFDKLTGPIAHLWRQFSGDRISQTRTVWHDLAWFIVQQRVSRKEASSNWSSLVRDLGSQAPGSDQLFCPPSPETIATKGYYDLHRYGIERQRAENLIAASRVVRGLEKIADRGFNEAMPLLNSIRGVGPWTTTCLATNTWGEKDTVVLGDYGIPKMVGWALAREADADDQRMLQLLEPYRPHRYRVVRLLFLSGVKVPRRAPRRRVNDIRLW